MLKDIPEIAERFPNLDDRLKAVTETQKILDKGLEAPRARKADLLAKFTKWRDENKARKERAKRLEDARKRLGYNINFVQSDTLKFHKGDFLYLPTQQPKAPKMTSITIITKRSNTMFDEKKSIEEIGSTAFTHGFPLTSYDPDCDPVAYAARVLLEAGLLPELEPFYMVEDGIARRREAVRFALMEDEKKDEFPDIEIPEAEPLTAEEQEAWDDHCDWFNNIMEYDERKNTPNTKEEDDLYKKGSPDLDF